MRGGGKEDAWFQCSVEADLIDFFWLSCSMGGRTGDDIVVKLLYAHIVSISMSLTFESINSSDSIARNFTSKLSGVWLP